MKLQSCDPQYCAVNRRGREIPIQHCEILMRECFDVVVVGFGLAGAIAAIEAHDAGAKVLLVEKESGPGGISICAGGGMRIAQDAAEAFAYLKATCAGTTPDLRFDGTRPRRRWASQLRPCIGRTVRRDHKDRSGQG